MDVSVFNPTAVPVPVVHPTAQGVERVSQDLRSVYRSGKTKTFDWRVSQLKALLKITTRHEKDIFEALRSDLNKSENDAYLHEVETSMINFPSSAEIVSEPLGVVLVISPWNYPFVLSLDPVVGAIAAGNAVVLKPSEVSPATSSLLSILLGEYMDPSAVKVVEGGVPETTALLEQKWDKILYTGNSNVGRIILTAAAKHLTPVVLELGGKCPVVVDSNIDLKIDALSSELENFYGKDPMQSKDLSRIINSRHFDRVTKLLDDKKNSGKVVIGGQWDRANLKIAPTVILDAPEDSLIMNEEIFGPLLPIVTVDKIEDSFGLINSKGKPLAAYLFTNDKKLKEEFIRNVSSGGMAINDTVMHITEPTLPFGGVGESGMGAYHGKFSFDTFSHKKAVLQRGFAVDADIRYPPFTPGKVKLMRALLTGDILGIPRALIGW
ncbi:hypothetical protein DH2020_033994 [Rehmannia glutinosa]|uniref:Aldehyde dehydrogenase n=1 Tax=Rehmannia glutinosa TaxID=99300 RepID=A0ABR0VAR7_REHGL